jgi:transporter family protein
VILQFVAALLGTCLLVTLMHCGGGGKLDYDKDGIRWSIMAGLAVGLAEMLSFCVSGLGVPATQSIPIIIGGSVMFGAVLGMIILGEEMMMRGWSGIALLVTGIVFVALDPEDKVEEGGTKIRGSTTSTSLPQEIIVVGGTGNPPIYWILIALICASAYAFYNIFIKKGSASISPILGGRRFRIIDFVASSDIVLISCCFLLFDLESHQASYFNL